MQLLVGGVVVLVDVMHASMCLRRACMLSACGLHGVDCCALLSSEFCGAPSSKLWLLLDIPNVVHKGMFTLVAKCQEKNLIYKIFMVTIQVV